MSDDAVDLKEIYSDLALMHSRLYVNATEGQTEDEIKVNLTAMFHSRRMIELAHEITSFLEREFYNGEK
jgi:hypothetical protein